MAAKGRGFFEKSSCRNADKKKLSLQEKKLCCVNSELSKLQSKQLDTYEEQVDKVDKINVTGKLEKILLRGKTQRSCFTSAEHATAKIKRERMPSSKNLCQI